MRKLVQYPRQLSLRRHPWALTFISGAEQLCLFSGLAQIGPWISWAANQDQNSLLFGYYISQSLLHTNFLHFFLVFGHLQQYWQALGRRTLSICVSFTFVLSSAFVSAAQKFHSRLSFTDSTPSLVSLCILWLQSRQRLGSNCARKSLGPAYLKKTPESGDSSAV